jgi:cysteine dioxygenase
MTAATAYTLDELIVLARDYPVPDELPIDFEAKPYSRVPIYRDDLHEVVIICFGPGQTSSVHDHQGSSCVVRVLEGKVLELFFDRTDDGDTILSGHHYLNPGDISGLDETRIHQIANMHPVGTVLLNFYSPPFQM